MNQNSRSRRCLAGIAAGVLLSLVSIAHANPPFESRILQKNQSNRTQWHTVTFTESFAVPPVVVMGPLSSAGLHPSTVRVRNVTATGFEWQIDEYEYLDGGHTTETVSFLAMEPGVYQIAGLTWEVGRANVGAGFATVALTGSHSEAPVVFSQAETANNEVAVDDALALVTRTRNVTTTAFEVRLQDQELNTVALAQESVGYLAITPGDGYLGGRPFSVLRTADALTDAYLTVDYGGLLRNAAILANQQTTDGGDEARIRFDNQTDSSVDLWLEEEQSNDDEVGHTTEVAGLFVFGEAYGEQDSKLEIFPINISHTWKQIDFSQEYSNPVVVLGPPSFEGADKSTVRVRNVTTTGFEAQIDEWDYRDGGHATETVTVAVMEAGVFEMGGLTWQASAVTDATHAQTAETFIDPFDDTPVVLGQIVTVNEPEALVHRFDNLTSDGFTVELDEEKANNGTHGPETVHYIAVEAGQGNFTSAGGLLFSVAVTPNTINHEDEVVDFGANYALPLFLADFQTRNGGDPSSLRVKALSAGQATVFLEEEDSTGDGVDHTNEVMGYLVTSTAIDTDGDGMGDDWETENGLDPNDPSDGDDDPDLDLLTNVEEYEAGYDPFAFSGGQITVSVLTAAAFETEGTRARFRIYRKVGKAEVTVNFSINGGSDPDIASDPTDYTVELNNGTALSGSVVIPEGAGSIDVYVDPIDDSVHEYPEQVRFQLLADADYVKAGPDRLATISDATDDVANNKLYVGLYQPEPWASGQTSASGYATLLVNGSNTQAVVGSSFSGLTTNQNAAHIHHADPSGPNTQGGPTVLSLPLGQVSGEIWNIQPTGSYTGQDLIDSLNKQNGLFLYTNVHTTQFQPGEIRAVLTLVDDDPYQPPSPPPSISPLTGDDLTRDVARFLTQATFGPTTAEITALVDDITNNHGGDRMAGFSAWIDQQYGLDQTNLYDYTYYADQQEWALRNADPFNPNNSNDPDHNNRRRGWWPLAISAHDQLRQRVGFALSQIFIISENESQIRVRHYGAAKYYDMLLDHADGNFRTILEDVSKSPMMGKYLSHLKNQAIYDNGELLVAPDENYAREIMQLFSIGLLELNPDGTLKLNDQGLPIQTYSNADITELSHVFTGWSFSKRHGAKADGYPVVDNTNFNYGNGPKYFQANWENPMKNFAANHDTKEKNFLGGTVDQGQTGEQDLDDALDIIHNHPNVGPFIARLLIQRLTHSNPSRGYIYRVAQAFESGTYGGSGSGQRGDIAATVKAILLDYEARTLTVADDVGYGKQKEPIIRYTQLLRALDGHSMLPISDLSGFGYPASQLDNFPSGASRYRYGDTNTVLSQSPLRAPSVFNWFLPDYEPGGDISAAGLVSPEMQQTTETQVIYNINYMRSIAYNDLGQSVNPLVGSSDANEDNVRIDRAPIQAIYDATISGGGTAEQAVTAVIDHLDLLLMSGNFKATYDGVTDPNPRSIIIDAVTSISAGGRVKAAIYLMCASPEYIHQK